MWLRDIVIGLLFKINMKGDVQSYDLHFRRNRDICCLFSAAGSHEIDSFEIRSNYYSTWCSNLEYIVTHTIYNFNAIGRGDISLAKNERTYQPTLVQNFLTAPYPFNCNADSAYPDVDVTSGCSF